MKKCPVCLGPVAGIGLPCARCWTLAIKAALAGAVKPKGVLA